ncbi:DUF2207 domain-containing protein [Candidatus Micrarchaeota archaeon]|nr:DUF2207 domain-containing protein [Candidatus Micrarchaeota archaeon]
MSFKLDVLLTLIILMTAFTYSKDYSIPSAHLEYLLNTNGSIHVTEEITYDLYDCDEHYYDDYFHELYLQKPVDMRILNPTGYCKGASCDFRYDTPEESYSGDQELVLELNDHNCHSVVTAHFEYDTYYIAIHNDTAQFYYKLWGDEWDKPTNLTVVIILPGYVRDTAYFVHPWDIDIRIKNESDRIILSTNQPTNTYLEINLLMPNDWFDNNGYYFHDYKYTKEDIIRIEQEEYNKVLFYKKLSYLTSFLAIIILVSPFVIFVYLFKKYGREYSGIEVGYHGIYEREPVEGFTPAEAIMFVEGGEFKHIERGLSATILSLVYKGYLDIQHTRKMKEDIVFVLNKRKEPVNLKPHELSVYYWMKGNIDSSGKIAMSVIKNLSKNKSFYDWFDKWQSGIKSNVNKYIDETGYVLFKSVMSSFLFFSLIAMIVIGVFMNELTAIFLDVLMTAFGIVFFLIFILLFVGMSKKMMFSRWTKEGRLLNLKFTNYKKYLSDFSLLRDHPPQTVKLWDYYMTYAVAFGVAKETIKAMKTIVPKKEIASSKFYPAYSYPVILSSLSSSVTPHYAPPTSSGYGYSSGSFGGTGGGGGGGGGGAR